MKKITSLLTLLLMFVCNAFAQDAALTSITVGQPVEEFTTDTWYLLYQRRGGDGYAHYENETTGFYKRATSFGQDPLVDGESLKQAEKWVLKFAQGEAEGTYKIQFANGAYWMATGTGNGAAIKPTTNKYDATDWAITRIEANGGIDGAGKPVFTINIGDVTGKRLDNNGNGGTLSMWDAGMPDNTESNAAWSIVAVELGTISPRDAAMAELIAVYTNYSTEEFAAGTEPGQYGQTEVDAFNAALDAASEADGPSSDSFTAEDLQKMAQDIKDAYEAVLNSRVPFSVAVTPGYYYIVSALDFKTTTTTEATEDPETGEEIPGEIIETHHTKAMYNDGLNGKWGEMDDAARQNANYVWKITEAGDKKYHLINTQTEAQFNAVATSAAITLSENSDSLIVFDTAGLEDKGIYNIRLAAQAERGYFYIHCDGHGGGTGKQGNLVGWCNTINAEEGIANASEWKLEAIDEATALAIIEACSPTKQIKAMTDSAAVIVAAVPATIAIAQDKTAEINAEYPLIQSVEQLSSPMTEPNEGSIAGLIDGDAGTFWHSQWSGGRQPANGTDYIQIEMVETDIADAAFVYTRRAVQNDHLTVASVYGTNDAEAEKNACELLATVNLPFTNNTETLTSDVFPLKGYQYIRIYAEATTNNRGYFHMAELQLYPATVSSPYATTQAKERAAEISALEAAIEAWKAIDLNAVKTAAEIQAQFDALTQAYAAWQAVYVNPAALRQAIANAPDTKVIKIGNNPGEWASAEGTVAGLVAKAQAYDESGRYTPAESQSYIEQLSKAGENMFAAANKVKTGKWYNIRFATEAEYDAAGWDKNPAKELVNENVEEEVSHALFGKYVAVGKRANETFSYTDEEGNDINVTQYNVAELTDEDATFGANAAFMNKEDLKNADAALWQFVAIGDSAYVLQNKATGLYMRTGNTGAVTMSIQPTTFTTSAIGYGKNLLKAVALTGANNNYLHAERSTNNLVTWNATTIESNSALYIEEVEDVTEQPSNDFTWSIWPGKVQTVCYPTSLTASGNAVLYDVTLDGTKVTLNPIKGNTIAAGKAAVLILDSPEDYEELVDDEDDENYNADNYELCTFTHGTEFVAAPDTTGIFRGCFVNETISFGNIWAEGNSMVLTKKSSNTLGANTAYIKAGIEDLESTIELIIENEEVDAIQSAVANVSKAGNIYTVDGKFVGRGNLNSLKEKGIFILNGVKVLVK